MVAWGGASLPRGIGAKGSATWPTSGGSEVGPRRPDVGRKKRSGKGVRRAGPDYLRSGLSKEGKKRKWKRKQWCINLGPRCLNSRGMLWIVHAAFLIFVFFLVLTITVLSSSEGQGNPLISQVDSSPVLKAKGILLFLKWIYIFFPLKISFLKF